MNQREISSRLGLSLGMTNLLLRRLVTKGMLRIRQLNRKKVDYLLTARGLAEKAQKSYNYTLKTIESFGLVKKGVNRVLDEQASSRHNQILIIGQGDFAELVTLLATQYAQGKYAISRADRLPDTIPEDMLALDANSRPEAPSSVGVVPLVHNMAKNLTFSTNTANKK